MNNLLNNIILLEDDIICLYIRDNTAYVDNKTCIYKQLEERGILLTPGTCMSYTYSVKKKF